MARLMPSLRLLVLNAGSSSLKYDVVEAGSAATTGPATRIAHGIIERIGRGGATDHGEATRQVLAGLDPAALDGIGYRVVHGGPDLVEPALVTPEVVAAIELARSLAPLHNGPALETIAAAELAVGSAVPGVAVFDTAFHATMPPQAARYAIPNELARRHRVRRYGFHGIAHRYLAERWSVVSGRPLDGSRLVTLQLGNGASVTAVADGRSVDTSMGFTPLEGLVMGTRSGDIDPTVVVHIAEAEGVAPSEVLGWLSTRSGLLGLSDGRAADMRDLVAASAAGDALATGAVEAFCYRAQKYVGAYAGVLGGVDGLVFGGGIGEHQPTVRAAICGALAWCGLRVDVEANLAADGHERRISATGSEIAAWVIPVDEAAVIASDVVTTLQRA